MKIALVLLAFLAGSADLPSMEGARLRTGETCYAITRNGVVVGSTWQAIRETRFAGEPVWDIIVHQRQNDGGFEMRDHFILDRNTLLPIRMESQRGHGRDAKGWHRISLAYTDQGVTGVKETAAGSTKVDVPLKGPAWDGNLWGVTFAALPLSAGGQYNLPFWQYEKGRGTFTVRVVGSEMVDTPSGKTAAWAIDAGDDPDQLLRYYIAKDAPMELGYRIGPFGQRLGGDCRDIAD